MTIQQQVFQAVRDRGYLDDWTTEQAAARQVCKLQEELAELLGVDVQAGALDKARADVERGKRGARD